MKTAPMGLSQRSRVIGSRGVDWRVSGKPQAGLRDQLTPHYRLIHSPSVSILHCVSKKTRQLWNGIAQNYTDRFRWHLAELFKILQN